MEVLDRKAKTIPQQLQSYSMKQFKHSMNMDKQAKKASILPSMEKEQEITRLRKGLALMKIGNEEAVTESTETNDVASGGTKATRETAVVEVVERRRSTEQQPKLKSPVTEVALMEGLERTRSPSLGVYDDDSRTTVITVDEGRRRRSSANASTPRSSTDSIERRREPRYYSPRASQDLGARDFYVVQVVEPLPKTRKGSKEVTRFREVTISQKEARYTARH